MRRPGAAVILLVLISFFSLTSCFFNRQEPVKSPSPVVSVPPKPKFSPDMVIADGAGLLSSGEYGKAMEVYKTAVSAHPDEPKLLAAYAGAFERIKNTAEESFNQKKRFMYAGELYSLLFRYYGHAKSLGIGLTFGPGFLDGRIKACAKALTEQGLALYREGKLELAVAVWEGVLKFAPDDEEVKKAVNVARVQMRNLKQ
ncbi:MAG: hypothetical protein M0Z59_01750 [Nitrospiraceae bacterium]|nr:hypothetical protein [Nitrospiraceae bacterium]